MTVHVLLGGKSVPIERAIFTALFKNSVVSGYAGVRKALEGKPLPFREFLKLARQAEIPYPLFFAPEDVVQEQLRIKTEKLMAGLTKTSFSMNSRNRVELCDVELVVKDLLRKQELLRRHDASLVTNPVVDIIKNSQRTVEDDAREVMEAVGINREHLRASKKKEPALEYLIGRLEARQVFVSRSAQHHMPQEMPNHAKFSGITIKDKKVPFIFLATGDEGEHLEPAGRKIFTLVLLTVLVAQGTFAPVNYDGHTRDESSPRPYEVAAEILMPSAEVRALRLPDLNAVKEAAAMFKVTPSAVAMRARRLARIDRETFGIFMDALEVEYNNRPVQIMQNARPVNALKKYNGAECSRRMLGLLDSGQLNATEFRRIMFFNKLPASKINEFREVVA